MQWSPEVEDLLERIRINAVNLSEYHRKRFFHFKSYGKYFRIPIIVLATVNSTASVGLKPVGVQDDVVFGITCAIGMVIGIITAVELYLNIQQSMESELVQSKEFYSLGVDIYKTLKLTPDERGENGTSYMQKKYAHFIKLKEASALLKKPLKTDALTKLPEEYKDTAASSLASTDTPRINIYAPLSRAISMLCPRKEESISQTESETSIIGDVQVGSGITLDVTNGQDCPL